MGVAPGFRHGFRWWPLFLTIPISLGRRSLSHLAPAFSNPAGRCDELFENAVISIPVEILVFTRGCHSVWFLSRRERRG